MSSPNRMFMSLLFACLQTVAFAADPGEQVLDQIFTGDSEHPYAEAVAIRGDKIVAVGTRAEAVQAVGHDAQAIDLKGNFLTPGLIDSHCHAMDGGLTLISADIGENVHSVDELVAFAADAKNQAAA